MYHIPIRYLLLAWGTKKLSIYGIKPNYKDNNELLGEIYVWDGHFHNEIRRYLEFRGVVFQRLQFEDPRISGTWNLFFNFQISCPESQRYQNWNATNPKLWLKKSKKTREDHPLILHLMAKPIDYPDDDVILRWCHDDVTLTFLCIITSQSNHMLTNLKYWDQLIYTINIKPFKDTNDNSW